MAIKTCEKCHKINTGKRAHLCEACYCKKIYRESPARREYIKKASIKWQKDHPKEWNVINRRNIAKWQLKNKEKLKIQRHQRYLKDKLKK